MQFRPFILLLLVARYCSESDAKDAVRKLHNYRIRFLYVDIFPDNDDFLTQNVFSDETSRWLSRSRWTTEDSWRGSFLLLIGLRLR